MKFVILTFLNVTVLFEFSSAQVIDRIKDASDDHSSQSSTSSSTYEDAEVEVETYYDQPSNDDYNSNYSTPLYYNEDQEYWSERKRNDSTYKYSALNLLYRQTTSSGQVSILVPELQFKLGGYYGSIRSNTLVEEGAKDEDSYQTIDIQVIGFQSNPWAPLAMNLSFGVMTELYSSNTYPEFVAGLRLKPTPAFAIVWEGRIARDQGICVRSEGTLSVQVLILRKPGFQISTDMFITSSTYYEEVNVQGFGFGLGLRF
ncbi:MAG: hypothetical protein ACI9JN_001533 [Bacteroidia bacterium]|jgi:hypothetical protein